MIFGSVAAKLKAESEKLQCESMGRSFGAHARMAHSPRLSITTLNEPSHELNEQTSKVAEHGGLLISRERPRPAGPNLPGSRKLFVATAI